MGVEPTILAAKDRINGFESDEGHLTHSPPNWNKQKMPGPIQLDRPLQNLPMPGPIQLDRPLLIDVFLRFQTFQECLLAALRCFGSARDGEPDFAHCRIEVTSGAS